MNHPSRLIAVALLTLRGAEMATAQESATVTRQDQNLAPMTSYVPKTASCRGVAIVSPGAGGSEDGYQYLGRTMSHLGYLTVVLGHQESGRRALRQHVRSHGLRDGLSELTTDAAAYRGRLLDIAAARQWATTQCDASDSVLIGHSMGAATAMMEAGARNNLGISGSDAFTSYIALSPQGSGAIFPKKAWSDIRRPVLLLTGTRDSELGGGSWQTRTEPYLNMPAGCKWLGVIDGASHMNFAGNGLSRQTEALTTRLIGAFLEARRQGDCSPPVPTRGLHVQSK